MDPFKLKTILISECFLENTWRIVEKNDGKTEEFLLIWSYLENKTDDDLKVPELKYNPSMHIIVPFGFSFLKFIYSEKATKFCEISTVDLTGTT